MRLRIDGRELDGNLVLPRGARTMLVVANGGAGEPATHANARVAWEMAARGSAAFCINLMTIEEEVVDRAANHLRFNIDLLARRFGAAADWIARNGVARGLPLAYFAANTFAAAALVAAARRNAAVSSLVLRSARPDLAGPALERLSAPALFIVGSADFPMIDIHRETLKGLSDRTRLSFVPGITRHAMPMSAAKKVADLAVRWIEGHRRGGTPWR